MSKIKLVAHPDAYGIMKSWEDEAIITGEGYVPKPFWFENIDTGQLYYDLYGCLGWPSEVNEKDDGLPGYVAIVGIVKPKSGDRAVRDSVFQILTEQESKDVPTLLTGAVRMREEYGYNDQPGLLRAFLGDPEKFITMTSLFNERLTYRKRADLALLISPPHDFFEAKAFETYVRAIRSSIMPEAVRLYFGTNDILRTRLRGFKKNDPSIMAMGGLVHTMLCECMWMNKISGNSFNVPDQD